MNQPARDGSFEFVVQSVKCGITHEGEGPLASQAQGQFCEVHMTVKNLGAQVQLLDANIEHGFDSAGLKYDADERATINANGDPAFLSNIKPGDTVTGVVVFDIPKGQKLSKLELHDLASSGGVTVTVS